MIRISLAQIDLLWENKQINLEKIEQIAIDLSGNTDLIVLPEMCTTGFSMNVQDLAETNEENTLSSLKKWAKKYNLAFCGSHIAADNGSCFNRAFFVTPEDVFFYDKKHLFRMGQESNYYEAGNKKLIIRYKDFNICMLVCYDLRFPVWSRNVDNQYDILIYVANWPAPRVKVWERLLAARAIENMCVVCGVNRVGVDDNNLRYNGHSKLIDARGDDLVSLQENIEQVVTASVEKEPLDKLRKVFPVWKDADRFNII